MGRAGAGSGGGGHSSGGHSSSRSSGGHHVSSGSSGRRAGGGGSFSGGSHYHSNNYGRFGGPPPGDFYGEYFPRPSRRNTVIINRGGSGLAGIVAIIIMVILILSISTGSSNSSSVPKSTQNREKIETGIGYDNNCIVDNIGWFDNVTKTEKSIKYFYDKTGIQPYVVLNAYDSTLKTDAEKEKYANEWYEKNISNESTFLFMYFAEEDTDNDVGYMAYVNGKQISSVMDSEAVEIFWAYVDEYWYSDMSTDDMFTTIFTKTADRIMDKMTTSADVGNNVVKVIGVIAVIGGIILIMVIKRKNEAEKAKETERILNTPLDGNSKADDLLKKYNKKGE